MLNDREAVAALNDALAKELELWNQDAVALDDDNADDEKEDDKKRKDK
jgi:hypothetical protein